VWSRTKAGADWRPNLGASAVVDPAIWRCSRPGSPSACRRARCTWSWSARTPGCHRGGLQPTGAGGILVMVGAASTTHLRHQPHDPQRAHRHRIVRLRPRWLRAGARAPRLRRLPADLLIDPADVTLDGITDASRAWRTAASPARSWWSGGEGLMAHPYYPSGNPRFNHVAMSLPADLLGRESRADICRFFHECWASRDGGHDEDRRRLILSCVHWDQFIFPSRGRPDALPRMDHYGFAVAPRRIGGHSAAGRGVPGGGRPPAPHRPPRRRQKVVKIHSLYVGYICP